MIDLGQSVTAYQKMLSVVNLNRVLIKGFLAPKDAWRVQKGDSVITTFKDFPDKQIFSRIEVINPSLDEINGAVAIHFHVQTINGWPKPGQNVRLLIQVRTAEPVIVIPLSAVIFDGETPQVFIKTRDLVYEKRTIAFRRMTDQDAIIQHGLQEGDVIAVSQVFNLKAMTRFKQFAE